MPDLRERFRVLDELAVPDVMPLVELVGPRPPAPEPTPNRRRIAAVLVAAAIAVLGIVIGFRALRSMEPKPAVTPAPTVSPSPVPDESSVERVGLPPPGAEPSSPEVGDLVISVDVEGYVGEHIGEQTQILIFADGRMIWRRDRCAFEQDACGPLVGADTAGDGSTGWVEQRLTPEAVTALRAELLATGFFERNHQIDKPFDTHVDWLTVEVTEGGRTMSLRTISNYLVNPLPSRQDRILTQVEELVADPSASLPDSAFADRGIRTFVPSRYDATFRWKPSRADLAELPSPADTLVHDWCETVTTEQAREIVAALDGAGIRRIDRDRTSIAYKWISDQERQQFRLIPELPDGAQRC